MEYHIIYDLMIKRINMLKDRTFKESDRLRALYIYGEFIHKNGLNLSKYGVFAQIVPLRIYNDTHTKVYQAIIYWLLICKQIGFYKDLARGIGKMLYETRMYPDEWGIEMKQEREKRKKRNKN
jgi:hypothetical protein